MDRQISIRSLPMLVDDFLPVYDVSDAVATVVEADVATTWDALMEVDLLEVGRQRPMVALLGALRTLPEMASHLLHGELPARGQPRMRLHDATALPPDAGGWVLLGERPRDEIALGLVGKFWRPVIEYALSPASFREFAAPRFAKTIYSLSVRELDGRRTLLSGVMRTATTRRARASLVPAVLDVGRRRRRARAGQRAGRRRARERGGRPDTGPGLLTHRPVVPTRSILHPHAT